MITILYSLSLLFIFLFSLSQLHLTWLYLFKKKTNTQPLPFPDIEPTITVQLPVYNEKYVVERLLNAVSQFDYPRHKLEIQVLDDSTDETTEIILKKLEALRILDLDIKLIHRHHREGFKAGALQHGLQSAKGEFIAIFDADFIPAHDFLKKTLSAFNDPSIGLVQTRWEHINRNYSLLTELQAFALDAHFSIEQSGRNLAGSFMNFNGTCGIWRKACIEDAGAWSADTLTEDLDLSYRAQLKGWRFLYLEHVATKGELPVIMPAIKSQQYRWNKGAAETARKHFIKVLSSKLRPVAKLHAFFHLLNSSVFTALLVAAVLSVPMVLIKYRFAEVQWIFQGGRILVLGFVAIALFYYTAAKQFHGHSGRKFINLFPPFLILSMGLSLHNGLAVLEGFMGRKTPFVRTPKFNLTDTRRNWKHNVYINRKLTVMTGLEGVLCLYFIAGIALGFFYHETSLIIFHTMLACGFASVFYYSVKP